MSGEGVCRYKTNLVIELELNERTPLSYEVCEREYTATADRVPLQIEAHYPRVLSEHSRPCDRLHVAEPSAEVGHLHVAVRLVRSERVDDAQPILLGELRPTWGGGVYGGVRGVRGVRGGRGGRCRGGDRGRGSGG